MLNQEFTVEFKQSLKQIEELNNQRKQIEAEIWQKIVAGLHMLINSNTKFIVSSQYTTEVIGVRWKQYTPYFNDGEPCVFSITSPDVLLKPTGLFESDSIYVEDTETEIKYEYLDEWDIKCSAADEEINEEVKGILTDFISEFDSVLDELKSFLEQQYGNNVEIHLFADRVVVTDYTDHD